MNCRLTLLTTLLFFTLVTCGWADDSPLPPLRLTLSMDAKQSSNAPVILYAIFTNLTPDDVYIIGNRNEFSVFLTGEDGKIRPILATNEILTSWYGGPPRSTIKPFQSLIVPLRLTQDTLLWDPDALPSEEVYLPQAQYRLDVLWRPMFERTIIKAVARTYFTVVNDQKLADARWDALLSPPKGQEEFAKYVVDNTITPELRQLWYQDIRNADPSTKNHDPFIRTPFSEVGRKVYILSRMGYDGGGKRNTAYKAPPDVGPGLLNALDGLLSNPKATDDDLAEILNAGVGGVLNYRPRNAGLFFLKATLRSQSFVYPVPKDSPTLPRTLDGVKWYNFDGATSGLRLYYDDKFAPSLLPLLRSQNSEVRFRVAYLLAWAGDDDAAPALIDMADDSHSDFRIAALCALNDLPHNKAASDTLKQALASSDTLLVAQVRKGLAVQESPRRGRKAVVIRN